MGDFGSIDRLAAKQHGVFNNAQLREAGFDKKAAQRQVRDGRWNHLDHRVYCLASAPASWERQMWVALLSRSAAVVGGQAAAALHQLRGYRQGRPVIVVPGSANARSEVARVIRAEYFPELNVESASGFPTTSVAETLVFLASELGASRLESVFDDALLAGKLDLTAIEAIIDRESGRRRNGIVKVRQLVTERDSAAPGIGSSYLEGILEQMLHSADVPPWTREHPFVLNGRSARVDAFISKWSLVIEADGRSWHSRTEDFENDRRRDNELASRGIQVLRFTYRMLNDDVAGCRRTILETGRLRRAGGVA